ncbi:DMT family transporter [Bacterioplanoides sp. SCSIO 12839]|uniref:DMT family transporter n=1 Tax=Bacterioplanoides sp. SCSIO 12839 TaxID=2829569 RepID=UPI0021028ADB|nr:DMT family transporter [Bacterioplanoides sp. SCSIO 12839]UTW47157.1 DMT family transporter [Bacterioplanoides sp. SCSIO 12839]
MSLHSTKADGLLIIVTLLAAISWMFSKEALAEFPPLLFIGSRFLLAGLLLAVVGSQSLRLLSAQQWRSSAAVGVFFGVAMSCWIMGLFYTTSLGEGSFITSMAVVFVAPLCLLFWGDKPPASTWVALPLSITGLALLALENGFNPEASQLFFFIAATLLAVTFILNGRAAANTPALALSAIQLSIVGLIALPLSLITETWPSAVTQNMGLWLTLSVVVGTSARFLLQTYAQGLTSPAHAAVIMILEPIWTASIAAFWFDERMSTQQLLGCALIFTSLLANRWNAVRTLFCR